jgi:hypothetical protein
MGAEPLNRYGWLLRLETMPSSPSTGMLEDNFSIVLDMLDQV